MNSPKSFLKPSNKSETARALSRVVPSVGQFTFDRCASGNWYDPVIIESKTVGSVAISPTRLCQLSQIIERLESEDHVRYLLAYSRAGLDRFGVVWHYADIITVLRAAVTLSKPTSYLELAYDAVWELRPETVRSARYLESIDRETRSGVGGILMFDNINHPVHPWLDKVWRQMIESDPRFSCWQYSELGDGVALSACRSA